MLGRLLNFVRRKPALPAHEVAKPARASLGVGGLLLDADSPPVRFPLAADPVLQMANSLDALKAYMASGDADALDVPDDAVIVTMRAVSAAERSTAQAKVGHRPQLGSIMFRERNAQRIEHAADEKLFAKWYDTLEADELKAIEDFDAWCERSFRLHIVASIVSVSAESPTGRRELTGADFMARIRNPKQYEQISNELSMRARQLSDLGAVPKGLSDSQYGAATTETCPAGRATIAPTKTSDGPAATAGNHSATG